MEPDDTSRSGELRLWTDLATGVDVANVGSDTRGAADIVEAQVGDMGVDLEEKRERLPDASVIHAGRTLLHVAVFRGRRLHTWPPSG